MAVAGTAPGFTYAQLFPQGAPGAQPAAAPQAASSYVDPTGGNASAYDMAQVGRIPANFAAQAAAANPASSVPPPAPPDPLQQYVDSFNNSIGQQRSAIDAQLHQQLGALAGRRDAANAVVAAIPANLASNYNFAAALQQTPGGKYSADVQQNVGKVGAGEMAALQADKAAAVGANPMLGLATRAAYDSGAAALNTSAMGAQNDLNQQARDFALKVMDEKIQRQQQVQDQTTQFNNQKTLAQIQHGYNMDELTARDKAAAAAQPAGGPEANTGLLQGEVNTIKASPEYAKWLSFITTAHGHYNDKADPAQVISVLQKSNPKMLTVLQQEHPEFFMKPDGKGGYSTTQLNSNLVARPRHDTMSIGDVIYGVNPTNNASVWNGFGSGSSSRGSLFR